MTQHEYAYDIKMFAIIRIKAEDKKQACKLAQQAADCALIDFSAVDDGLKAAIVDATIEVDDVAGPCLFEIDGEDVDPAGLPW